MDILPDMPEDDGTAYISFYLEPEADQEAILSRVRAGLEEIQTWGLSIGEGTITASETEDKDWINNWKEYFHQFYVDDILIKPSWEETKPEDADKLLIQIDPGTAFGTGMHETTQLCIRQIRKHLTKETAERIWTPAPWMRSGKIWRQTASPRIPLNCGLEISLTIRRYRTGPAMSATILWRQIFWRRS